MTTDPRTHPDHNVLLQFIGTPNCTCTWRQPALGQQWTRIATAGACPHHGRASRAHALAAALLDTHTNRSN